MQRIVNSAPWPAVAVQPGGAPAVLIDALNVAFWAGAPPSLRVPLAIAKALIARGRDVRLVFDASTPHRLADEERAAYDRLMAVIPCALQVPSGHSADRWLLQAAKATGGVIVSRDHFRQHRRGYVSIIHNPARRLDGWVAADGVRVPGLHLMEALPESAYSTVTDLARLRG